MNHLNHAIVWMAWKLSGKQREDFLESFDWFFLLSASTWLAAWRAWHREIPR
jgi:hypothetical protein